MYHVCAIKKETSSFRFRVADQANCFDTASYRMRTDNILHDFI